MAPSPCLASLGLCTALHSNFVKRQRAGTALQWGQKGKWLGVKFALINGALWRQRLPRHSHPLGCGAESQQFAWNAF